MKLLKFLTLLIGIGAVVGALMMWIDPIGMMCGCEPLLDMLRTKMPWGNLFFKNFVLSGFALLVVIGFSQLAAAYLLFKKHPSAHLAMFVSGILLMLWTALEWWVWDFNTMSNLFFVFGVIEVLSALYIFVTR